MSAIIIFDVSTGLDFVSDALRRIGYYQAWKSNDKSYYLPKSVFWKPDIELKNSLSELQGIIGNLNNEDPSKNIILLRCIVLSGSPWEGIAGTPHS